MTIDILTEPLITFNEAAKVLPDGSRPSCSTWWRWWKRGLHGKRLETVLIGSRRYTTAEAVVRWITAVSAAADGQPSQFRSPARREREIRAAEKELKRAGICGAKKGSTPTAEPGPQSGE